MTGKSLKSIEKYVKSHSKADDVDRGYGFTVMEFEEGYPLTEEEVKKLSKVGDKLNKPAINVSKYLS